MILPDLNFDEPQVLPDLDFGEPSDGYGLRADGTKKGKGFLGEIKNADGSVSTEVSIGVNIDGKETEIPLLIPTLTEDEIKIVTSGGEVPKEIIDKAVSHAMERIKTGASPFADGQKIKAESEGKLMRGAKAIAKATPRGAYHISRGINDALAVGAGVLDYAEKGIGKVLGTGSTGIFAKTRDWLQGAATEQGEVLSGEKKALGGADIGVSKEIKDKKLIDDFSLLLDPEYMITQTGDAAAQLVPMIAAAYATGGGSTVAGITGGLQEAGSFYNEIRSGGKTSEEDALSSTLAYGVVSSALNKLGIDKLLAKTTVNSMIKKVGVSIAKGGFEAATEYIEELASAIIKTATEEGLAAKNLGSKIWDSVKEAATNLDVMVGATIAGGGVSFANTKVVKDTKQTAPEITPELPDLDFESTKTVLGLENNEFKKILNSQQHDPNSVLNKYLFTQDTTENVTKILTGKSGHPQNLVYWQEGRLHHQNPNKAIIVIDKTKIDPSLLKTEREGVGEYLINAKDINDAIVGSYKHQYELIEKGHQDIGKYEQGEVLPDLDFETEQDDTKPITVYQGRSRKGIKTFFNKDGVAWGTTEKETAGVFANIVESHYPYRDPPETTREMKGDIYKLEFNIKNPMEVDIQETLWDRKKEQAKIKEAKEKGYDGLVIIHPTGKKDYVAFNKDQVTKQADTKASVEDTTPTTQENLKADQTVEEQVEEDYKEPFEINDSSSMMDNFKYHIVDMLNPVSKLYKSIKGKISEKSDFLLAERLRVSKAKEGIEEADRKYFTPIKKIIGKSGLDVEKVDEFLYARHAPEANARLRLTNARHYLVQLAQAQKGDALYEQISELDERFESGDISNTKMQEEYINILNTELEQATTKKEINVKNKWEEFSEKPSGMTDAEASELSKKWSGNKSMTEIATLFDAMNNESLETSYKAGRLSESEYNNIKGTFENYAPLKREGFADTKLASGTGKGLTNLGSDVMARGGSTRKAVHILANAIMNTEKTIIKAKKADVAKVFLNFVKENPNEDFWQFEETKTRNAYDTKGNIKKVPAQTTGANEVSIKVDGKMHNITVNPDNVHAMRILNIIRGNQDSSGPIVGALSRINRLLAAVNTTWNPEFIISNLTRDLQTAAFNLNDTQVSNVKTKIFKSLPTAMKGLHSVERGDGTHEWADTIDRYKKSGAKIGWIDYGSDVVSKGKKLESEIDLFRPGHVTKKTVNKLVSFVEDYNSIVENAIRLSTFKAGIDAGMSDAKAGMMAKNLTVNFNQKGASGQVINSLYLFANAGIQGSTRIVTALKNSPTARRMAGASIMTAAGMSIANSSIGGDDEDGVPYYDQIDDHVKARNMVFMLPNTKGNYVKIPLPWGYNVFWAMGTEMGDAYIKDDYKPVDGASRMLSTALDAFNPLQSSTLLQTVSPTIGDPLVQVGENKTFFGAPLMPEQNIFDKSPEPDSEKYWSSVRGSSKLVSRELNKLTGGDRVKPGLVDISPETLDLVFDTFTGGAGRFVSDTLSLPYKAITKNLEVGDIPMARRLIGTKSEYKTSSEFQKNTSYVHQLRERIKAYPEKKSELKKDKAYKLFNLAKNSEKRIRALKKRLKVVKSDSAKERIQKKIGHIEKTFNIKFNR